MDGSCDDYAYRFGAAVTRGGGGAGWLWERAAGVNGDEFDGTESDEQCIGTSIRGVELAGSGRLPERRVGR